MATLTRVDFDEARALGALYDVDVARVVPIVAGSVNSNFRLEGSHGRFFLRVYEEQARAGACAESELLDQLARGGVPTPRPVPLASGDGFIATHLAREPDGTPRGERPVALFPWVDGDILCTRAVTPLAARAVGAALARAHLAQEGLVGARPGRFRPSDLRARLARIASEAAPELAREVPALSADLDAALALRDRDLPAGVIHGDLFRDNVLFRGDEVVALLDFESACDGSFAYDLMVTALAFCFGDDLDLSKVSAMIGGYESARPLGGAERTALFAEGCVAALRFAITRITDFAMRPAGTVVLKDWRRFRARHARLVALGPAKLAAL